MSAWNKGKRGLIKHSKETKAKLSLFMKTRGNKNGLMVFQKGNIPWNKGKKMSLETRIKMSQAKLGVPKSEETKKRMGDWQRGDKHYRWNPNRSEVRYDRRNDPEYKQWRKQVWLRDNFKCKIGNPDCFGRIEAHHILSWSKYPELRYNINNGITLCHFHHPFGREEEKRLIPTFMELVSVSSE